MDQSPRTVRTCLILVCVSFLSGVWMHFAPVSLASFSALASICVYGVWALTRRGVWALCVLCMFCAYMTGASVYMMSENKYMQGTQEVRAAHRDASMFLGSVVSDGDERETDTTYVVRLDGYTSTSGDVHAFSHAPRARLIVPRTNTYAYGSQVEIDGSITFPKPFLSKDGKVVDMSGYMRSEWLVGDIRFARVKEVISEDVLGDTPIHSLEKRAFQFLYATKHVFRDSIRSVFDEPYASLGLGLVIGEKHGLLARESDVFTRTGLSHIVVLSGANIVLVLSFVFLLCAFFSRWVQFALGAFIALLFVLMTGASETAVRAYCMALCVQLGKLHYRTLYSSVLLLLVATGMVAWNPFIVRDSISFQLSVLATFGIIVFGGLLQNWFTKYVGAFFADVLGCTFAASVFVLPYVAYVFGTLSLISPLANMLVVPLVPFAMFGVALSGFGALLSGVLAFPFVLATQSLLALMFFFAELCARVPFASIEVVMPLWVLVGSFIVALCVAFVTTRDSARSQSLE